MLRCEVCGNECDYGIRVVDADMAHIFDSFQCAIQRLAPECEYCGSRILGHALAVNGRSFCSEHCASMVARTRRTGPQRLQVSLRAE